MSKIKNMPKQREFLKLPKKVQIERLLTYLGMAMQEHPEICSSKYALHHKTDIIGIALQYGKNINIKREDFDSISNLTVSDIIEMFNQGYKK